MPHQQALCQQQTLLRVHERSLRRRDANQGGIKAVHIPHKASEANHCSSAAAAAAAIVSMSLHVPPLEWDGCSQDTYAWLIACRAGASRGSPQFMSGAHPRRALLRVLCSKAGEASHGHRHLAVLMHVRLGLTLYAVHWKSSSVQLAWQQPGGAGDGQYPLLHLPTRGSCGLGWHL